MVYTAQKIKGVLVSGSSQTYTIHSANNWLRLAMPKGDWRGEGHPHAQPAEMGTVEITPAHPVILVIQEK